MSLSLHLFLPSKSLFSCPLSPLSGSHTLSFSLLHISKFTSLFFLHPRISCRPLKPVLGYCVLHDSDLVATVTGWRTWSSLNRWLHSHRDNILSKNKQNKSEKRKRESKEKNALKAKSAVQPQAQPACERLIIPSSRPFPFLAAGLGNC